MQARTVISSLTITVIAMTLGIRLLHGTVAPPAPSLALAASPPVTAMSPEASRPAEVGTEIHFADPELTAVIEAAVDRHNSVGLTLPPLQIYSHLTKEGCRGNSGLFTYDGFHRRIDLCTRVPYTILHELAHAWEHYTMSDATRRAFLDHTGLDVWGDPGTDWDEQGTEAAAQAIAWGLLDTPITRPDRFHEEILRFELLTGIRSPRLPDTD